MQKAFIAIALALTLSCVVADYTVATDGWAKAPVSVCNDTDLACVNNTNIVLSGMTTSDLTLFAYNAATVDKDATNKTTASWSVFYKTLATKDFSSSGSTTSAFKAYVYSGIGRGYAIGFVAENDTTGTPQIFLYQTKVNGGATIPRVAITANTNKTFQPAIAGSGGNMKNSFFCFTVAEDGKTINCTSYAAEAATVGKIFTLTTTYTVVPGRQIGLATGEALSWAQAYAGWDEGTDTAQRFKVALLDFGSGSAGPTTDIGGWTNDFKCKSYATDKKYYGAWCTNKTENFTDVYVSANSTSLLKMFSVNKNITVHGPEAYGPYLAVTYTDSKTDPKTTVKTYDIWDVEKFVAFKTSTKYLSITNGNSTIAYYTIPQGGKYGLVYSTNATAPNQQKSQVFVGLLLSASYLTTVFGSLLTIIAGLLLF